MSADLRERQRGIFRQSKSRTLPIGCPGSTRRRSDHRGVILANEVLDALPVERFLRRAAGVMQQRVGTQAVDSRSQRRQRRPCSRRRSSNSRRSWAATLPDGYVSEIWSCVCPIGSRSWARGSIEGVALLFDYGVSRREYYAAERSDGWLRCHFRHHAHNDPLILPGIQDLTAWVDFTRVAEAAVDAGFDVAGLLCAGPVPDGGRA